LIKRVYVVIFTILAASAFAQTAPSSRLGDLKPFAGSWRCTGKAFKTQWGPEHPTIATIHVTWVLNSFWLHANYAEQKTKSNPHPAAGHVYWGYDEKLKKLAGYAVNNFGGRVAVESDGWNGDTIVWSGEMSAGGTSFPTRDTFVRRNKSTIEHKSEAQVGGNWIELDTESCRKQ